MNNTKIQQKQTTEIVQQQHALHCICNNSIHFITHNIKHLTQYLTYFTSSPQDAFD